MASPIAHPHSTAKPDMEMHRERDFFLTVMLTVQLPSTAFLVARINTVANGECQISDLKDFVKKL